MRAWLTAHICAASVAVPVLGHRVTKYRRVLCLFQLPAIPVDNTYDEIFEQLGGCFGLLPGKSRHPRGCSLPGTLLGTCCSRLSYLGKLHCPRPRNIVIESLLKQKWERHQRQSQEGGSLHDRRYTPAYWQGCPMEFYQRYVS